MSWHVYNIIKMYKIKEVQQILESNFAISVLHWLNEKQLKTLNKVI